jgi:hypothetical protein
MTAYSFESRKIDQVPSLLLRNGIAEKRSPETFMDPKYFRKRAAVCRRIADGLSWNSRGHIEFRQMAESFEKRAMELELRPSASCQLSEPAAQQPQKANYGTDKPERRD